MEEVGCRRCGKGDGWKVYADGKGIFEFRHPCGHSVKLVASPLPDGSLTTSVLTDRPDPKAYDMRFFT